MGLQTDDQLRHELFDALVERLDAARESDEATVVASRTPTVFSLSKRGTVLTVYQGQGPRLLRGELQWKDGEDADDHDQPWRFSVSRGANRFLLAITPGGFEGTAEEIVALIVETFIEKTAPDER